MTLADSIALGAVLVSACARTLIAFSAIPVFDIDPALDGSAAVGGSPADSVVLDALALAGAGWLLLRSHGRVAKVAAAAAILVVPAMIVALVHAWSDAEQLWRGATWITGVLCALALWWRIPTDRSRTLASAAAATLAGACAVMAVRGLSQMISEHGEMVDYYSTSREAFLSAQGWLIDSPQALSYERRLMQNEPTAWFGFSNVFATAVGGASVLLGNLALGQGVRWSQRVVLFGAVVLCAGLVVAGGSKGGTAAMAIGVAISVICRSWPRAVPWALVALPLVAIAGIAARGALGDRIGELSLLFRWQYLVGAAGTFAESPWFGVGPAGFQTAFMQHRPSSSVEEVLSAHGAFADWLAAFGVAGAGMIVLQLLLAARAGRATLLGADTAKPDVSRHAQEIAVAVIVFAGVISVAFEAPALDGVDAFLWRLGGIGVGTFVAMSVARLCGSGGLEQSRSLAVGMAALVAVVVTHGQVDMAFWLPGSALWMWCALGVGAGIADRAGETWAKARWVGIAAASTCFALALVLAIVAQRGLAGQDEMAILVAEQIHKAADSQNAGKLASARAHAAASLATAAQSWPRRDAYAVKASEQWQSACELVPLDPRVPGWLDSARTSAQDAASGRAYRFQGRLSDSSATIRQARSGTVPWQDAAASLMCLVELNPKHTEGWIRLADALDHSGDPAGARLARMAALEADASYSLDPVRQLPSARREDIKARIAEEH